MKVCNQYHIRNVNRYNYYLPTIKCNFCKERSNLEKPHPFELQIMINFLTDFIKLHKRKGCNKIQLPDPYWASKKVDFGISA